MPTHQMYNRSPLKKRQHSNKRSPAIKKISGNKSLNSKRLASNGASTSQLNHSAQPETPLARLSQDEKNTLYFGVSGNDEGRQRFLKMRQQKSPKQRYGDQALTSQHEYGWFMNDKKTQLAPPQYAHLSKTREFFSNDHGNPFNHGDLKQRLAKPDSPARQEVHYQLPEFGRKKRIQMTFFEERKNAKEYGRDYIFPQDPEYAGADRFDKFVRREGEGFTYTRPTENVRVRATDKFFSAEPFRVSGSS
mmetsp:Transcript_5814/g.22069  ORF Transcript_5814/g.22069 Transcript_5814/m.22069 type:complete len:248 (-) Transcript_5814:5142-5885(-)